MLRDKAMSRIGRVLINVSELRRVPVDPNDVYLLEAVGDDTLVRLRSKRRLRDVRPLGSLLKEFALRVPPNPPQPRGQLGPHPGDPQKEGEGRLGG